MNHCSYIAKNIIKTNELIKRKCTVWEKKIQKIIIY